jgi:hypothetical protein
MIFSEPALWFLLAQLCLVENVVELPEASQAYKVDLCHFSTLGGVYHLDVLELPPQCKPVKGWVLVEVGDSSGPIRGEIAWLLLHFPWPQPLMHVNLILGELLTY